MCRDSIKGVRALVASGSVEASPEAIASFLRQHNSSLDKEQLGEYLGHHDELEVNPHCCIPAKVCCQFKLLGGLVLLWDHFALGPFVLRVITMTANNYNHSKYSNYVIMSESSNHDHSQ